MVAEPTAQPSLFWAVELPANARSTGSFSGSQVGFSFAGRGDTGRGFAELGPERNGSFLT